MNVTLLRWTVDAALSSQVVSSGQYNTYVCSSAVDVNVRMMYNPDLRVGSAPLAVQSHCGTSNSRSLYIRVEFPSVHLRINPHFEINRAHFTKECHDFLFRSIDTDGLE